MMSDNYHDILLTITKASLQPDGSIRWQAVASDTERDKAGEATTISLFQDWIDRVTYKAKVSYLPEPKMPFLGVSHYPSLDGYGEAGTTRRMFIDGNTFKADGVFRADNSIGQKLLTTIKEELALSKKGETVEKPVRISAGWWDIQHFHEDSNYTFTRQSLTDKCPLCEKGQLEDKKYTAGQLDHFAATRVPMNPRTTLGLEEKSMANKITRREDAESIIGPDGALEMERRARMVNKSETSEAELPDAMVVKAGTGPGSYLCDMRKRKNISLTDVAKATGIKEARLKRLEDDEDEMDDEAMETMATALKMSDKEKEEMLDRFGKKRRKAPPTNKAEVEVAETVEDKPEEAADPVEKMGDNEDDYKEMSAIMPFGGATSIKDAEGYIAAREKMGKLYSYWDIFQSVTGNIMMADEDAVPDKVAAMSQAVKDLGGKIDTLKAGLSDAFLIQESAAAYEAAEDYIDEDEDYEDEVTIMTTTVAENLDTPEAVLAEARKAALENKALTREQREGAVQEAFNNYAEAVKAQLQEADPVSQAEMIAGAIKGALTDVMAPLAEQVGLLTAKMNMQAPQTPQAEIQQVYVPQQKSFAGYQSPQPVQAEGGQHAVSPVTGKPSPLTDAIRRSVGIPL